MCCGITMILVYGGHKEGWGTYPDSICLLGMFFLNQVYRKYKEVPSRVVSSFSIRRDGIISVIGLILKFDSTSYQFSQYGEHAQLRFDDIDGIKNWKISVHDIMRDWEFKIVTLVKTKNPHIMEAPAIWRIFETKTVIFRCCTKSGTWRNLRVSDPKLEKYFLEYHVEDLSLSSLGNPKGFKFDIEKLAPEAYAFCLSNHSFNYYIETLKTPHPFSFASTFLNDTTLGTGTNGEANFFILMSGN